MSYSRRDSRSRPRHGRGGRKGDFYESDDDRRAAWRNSRTGRGNGASYSDAKRKKRSFNPSNSNHNSGDDEHASGGGYSDGRRKTIPEPPRSNHNSGDDEFSNDDFESPSKRKILSRRGIIHSDSESDNETDGISGTEAEENDDNLCPICLGEFEDQLVGEPENCKHIFCIECITEWSKNVNNCPVDRKKFNIIRIRNSEGVLVEERIVEDVRKNDDVYEDPPTYCQVCNQCDREDCMLLCDMCDQGYHMDCLTPPLDRVPIDEWFCSICDPEPPPEPAHKKSEKAGKESGKRSSHSSSRKSRGRNRSASAVDEAFIDDSEYYEETRNRSSSRRSRQRGHARTAATRRSDAARSRLQEPGGSHSHNRDSTSRLHGRRSTERRQPSPRGRKEKRRRRRDSPHSRDSSSSKKPKTKRSQKKSGKSVVKDKIESELQRVREQIRMEEEALGAPKVKLFGDPNAIDELYQPSDEEKKESTPPRSTVMDTPDVVGAILSFNSLDSNKVCVRRDGKLVPKEDKSKRLKLDDSRDSRKRTIRFDASCEGEKATSDIVGSILSSSTDTELVNGKERAKNDKNRKKIGMSMGKENENLDSEGRDKTSSKIPYLARQRNREMDKKLLELRQRRMQENLEKKIRAEQLELELQEMRKASESAEVLNTSEYHVPLNVTSFKIPKKKKNTASESSPEKYEKSKKSKAPSESSEKYEKYEQAVEEFIEEETKAWESEPSSEKEEEKPEPSSAKEEEMPEPSSEKEEEKPEPSSEKEEKPVFQTDLIATILQAARANVNMSATKRGAPITTLEKKVKLYNEGVLKPSPTKNEGGKKSKSRKSHKKKRAKNETESTEHRNNEKENLDQASEGTSRERDVVDVVDVDALSFLSNDNMPTHVQDVAGDDCHVGTGSTCTPLLDQDTDQVTLKMHNESEREENVSSSIREFVEATTISKEATPILDTRSREATPVSDIRSRETTPVLNAKSKEPSPTSKSKTEKCTSKLNRESREATPLHSELMDPSPISERVSEATSLISTKDSRAASPTSTKGSRPASPTSTQESRATSPISTKESRAGSPTSTKESRAGSPTPTIDFRASSPPPTIDFRASSPPPTIDFRASSPPPAKESRACSPTSTKESRAGSPASTKESRVASPASTRESRAASPSSTKESRFTSPTSTEGSRLASPTSTRGSRITSPKSKEVSRPVSPTLTKESLNASPVLKGESKTSSSAPKKVSRLESSNHIPIVKTVSTQATTLPKTELTPATPLLNAANAASTLLNTALTATPALLNAGLAVKTPLLNSDITASTSLLTTASPIMKLNTELSAAAALLNKELNATAALLNSTAPLLNPGLGSVSPLLNTGLSQVSPLINTGLGPTSPLLSTGLTASASLLNPGLAAVTPLLNPSLTAPTFLPPGLTTELDDIPKHILDGGTMETDEFIERTNMLSSFAEATEAILPAVVESEADEPGEGSNTYSKFINPSQKVYNDHKTALAVRTTVTDGPTKLTSPSSKQGTTLSRSKCSSASVSPAAECKTSPKVSKSKRHSKRKEKNGSDSAALRHARSETNSLSIDRKMDEEIKEALRISTTNHQHNKPRSLWDVKPPESPPRSSSPPPPPPPSGENVKTAVEEPAVNREKKNKSISLETSKSARAHSSSQHNDHSKRAHKHGHKHAITSATEKHRSKHPRTNETHSSSSKDPHKSSSARKDREHRHSSKKKDQFDKNSSKKKDQFDKNSPYTVIRPFTHTPGAVPDSHAAPVAVISPSLRGGMSASSFKFKGSRGSRGEKSSKSKQRTPGSLPLWVKTSAWVLNGPNMVTDKSEPSHRSGSGEHAEHGSQEDQEEMAAMVGEPEEAVEEEEIVKQCGEMSPQIEEEEASSDVMSVTVKDIAFNHQLYEDITRNDEDDGEETKKLGEVPDPVPEEALQKNLDQNQQQPQHDNELEQEHHHHSHHHHRSHQHDQHDQQEKERKKKHIHHRELNPSQIEKVKKFLKPYYRRRMVTKEQWKAVMKDAVRDMCKKPMKFTDDEDIKVLVQQNVASYLKV